MDPRCRNRLTRKRASVAERQRKIRPALFVQSLDVLVLGESPAPVPRCPPGSAPATRSLTICPSSRIAGDDPAVMCRSELPSSSTTRNRSSMGVMGKSKRQWELGRRKLRQAARRVSPGQDRSGHVLSSAFRIPTADFGLIRVAHRGADHLVGGRHARRALCARRPRATSACPVPGRAGAVARSKGGR